MVRALFVEISRRPRIVERGRRISFRFEHLGRAADGGSSTARNVYLPPEAGLIIKPENPTPAAGKKIEAGKLPVVMLVRDGTVLPQIKLAQSTLQMDWSQLDLVVFARDAQTAKGLVYLPADNVLRELSLNKPATRSNWLTTRWPAK